MKKTILFFLIFTSAIGMAKTEPKSADEDRAIERLRKLEQEIRARAAEADAEIQKTRDESAEITKKAEAAAKRARDEANEYVQKIQNEIAEIEKGQGSRIPGAPDRELFRATLEGLADPLLECWKSKNRKALDECLLTKVQTGLAPHVQSRYPSSLKPCMVRCD